MSKDIQAVTVPKWGIEMQEGTVVNWHVAEGDDIEAGDELVDIETDKIVNTMEAPAGGVLKRQVVAEGETLKVGSLIGVIATVDVGDTAIENFIAEFSADEVDVEDAPAAEPQADPKPSKGCGAGEKRQAGPRRASSGRGRVRVSPAAKQRARELGIDIDQVRSAGGRRIKPEDVEQYAQSQDSATGDETEEREYEAVPFSTIRKTIARKLVEAKQQIPHFYLSTRIEMDAALVRRREINEAGEQKVSVNALVARAAVLALRAVPEVNVHVTPDAIRRFGPVHLAVAVDTDRGLMTPIIRDADALDIRELAEKIASQAQRARDGSLKPKDLDSGTFTVSNLGMLGITNFQAIINPPQGAILAVGACQEKLVPGADGPRQVTVVDVSLSCDHRAVDGALGARFLAQLKAALEDPAEI